MKLYKCNIGDKVQIVGGLANGCTGGFNVVGTIISQQDFLYIMNKPYMKVDLHGLVHTMAKMNDGEISFIKAECGECCIWKVNPDCEVQLLEKSKSNNNKNIKEKNMKDFKIKDYKVYEDTALIVEFEDGTKEKAVCNEDDKFDIERGITICVLKHLFGVDGYKSMVKKAMNQIKAVDKAKEDKKKEEELIARKKAKAARKKARRLERKRNERIEEMKTAYLAAMKEHDKDDISAALDDILDDLK